MAVAASRTDHKPRAASSSDEIETAIGEVCAARQAWADLDLIARARLLEDCQALLKASLTDVCAESAALKGSYGTGLGEEMCGRRVSHLVLPLRSLACARSAARALAINL